MGIIEYRNSDRSLSWCWVLLARRIADGHVNVPRTILVSEGRNILDDHTDPMGVEAAVPGDTSNRGSWGREYPVLKGVSISLRCCEHPIFRVS